MILTHQNAQQSSSAVTQHIRHKVYVFSLSIVLGGLMYLALISGAKADQVAQSITGRITIEWKEPSKIKLSPAELPGGGTNFSYPSIAFRADGGSGPYIFFVSKGVLPQGMVLQPTTGLLSGVPVQSGVFKITVEARDARQTAGSKEYRITIAATQAPPPSAPPIPPKTTGGDCGPGQVRFGANCVAGGPVEGPLNPPVVSQQPPTTLNPPTLVQQPRPQQPAKNLVTLLQRQLIRLGCLRGRADGKWGKGSRAALSRFVKQARLNISRSQPSRAALTAANNSATRFCLKGKTKSKSKLKPKLKSKPRSKPIAKRCPQGTFRKAGECIPQRFNCPANSKVRNGQCTCNRGFQIKNGQCVRARKKTQQPRCEVRNAYYDRAQKGCVCKKGYQAKGSNRCVRIRKKTQQPRCEVRNAYYDRARKGCVCKKGYQPKGSNRCVRIRKKSQPARCTGGAFRASNGKCRCEGSVMVYRGGKCVRPKQKKKRKGKLSFQECKAKCTRRLVRCAKKYNGNANIKKICTNKVIKCAYKYGCPGAL